MKKVNLPDDIESPNDCFFTHRLVEELSKAAATKERINWDQLFGETIEERRGDLYCSLKDHTQTIVKLGGKGFFWIVTSPELASILSSSKQEFNFSDAADQMPLGYDYVLFEGILQKRWRVYSDPLVPINQVLIGTGFRKKISAYYAVLTIDNFV